MCKYDADRFERVGCFATKNRHRRLDRRRHPHTDAKIWPDIQRTVSARGNQHLLAKGAYLQVFRVTDRFAESHNADDARSRRPRFIQRLGSSTGWKRLVTFDY
jgi:hypothetical protein